WRDTTNEKTAFYAECHSTGEGANAQKRVKWSHQLTSKEAQKYTIKNIFYLNDSWLPSSEK
ncbi:MAG: pectin esterase, partial [Pseudopedobacter saltans]